MGFWDSVTGPATLPQRAPILQPQPFTTQHVGYPPSFAQPVEDPDVEAAKRRAPSSRSTLTCPNCGSDNVCKPSPNTMEQCYACGWNPRFEHSTAGAGMPTGGQTGPTRASRQISTANNFNPQVIVATVG